MKTVTLWAFPDDAMRIFQKVKKMDLNCTCIFRDGEYEIKIFDRERIDIHSNPDDFMNCDNFDDLFVEKNAKIFPEFIVSGKEETVQILKMIGYQFTNFEKAYYGYPLLVREDGSIRCLDEPTEIIGLPIIKINDFREVKTLDDVRDLIQKQLK